MQTPSEPRSPLIALDLLRGLAAITVLVSHLRGNVFVEFGGLPDSQRDTLTALFFASTRIAHEAVIVFFVLSGFLVGGQVLTRLQGNKFSLYEYAIDRSTRILIPLIPACLFTAVVDLFLFQRFPGLLELVANMTGLNEIITPSLESNAVLWSLAYEIWFYILAGALAYIASQRINFVCLLVLATCGIVFTILQTRYLAFWIIGACFSLCINIRFKGSLAAIGTLLALGGTVFYHFALPSRSITSIAFIPPALAESLICVGVAIALPFLASEAVNKSLLRVGSLGRVDSFQPEHC